VRLVIDASVALKWVLDEPDSAAALVLREDELMAPSLWLAEVANALWRTERMGLLSSEEARGLLADLSNAPIVSFPLERYVEQALTLGMELQHPIYDCVYLALAMHHNVPVVTADRRFAAIAARPGMTDRIRLLGV
jgi:predicted nucleic acid-binding protein